MKWESGVVTMMQPIATYRYNKMTLKCYQNDGWYIVQWHNGRQTGRIGYTKDKDEANNYILNAIQGGYKRV